MMARVMRVAVGALALAGCQMAMPESNPDAAGTEKPGFLTALTSGGAGSKDSTPPLARVSLAGGDVIVQGPEGYCLDPQTSRSGGGRGFAVIASCLILSEGKVGGDVPPVIVTVAVGPRGETGELPTPAALADAANAPLIGGETRDGLVLAHLGLGGDKMLDGGDTRYWRGAFVEGGRMVGLALYAPRGNAMVTGRGAGLLVEVRDSISAASATRQAVTSTRGATEGRTASGPGAALRRSDR